ncbi:hypothetical protein SDC9_195164 [bioreactor metagenome]|uniref:Uncharacterized protein n=1 Tax=bioreactor metagenome TaxID=1076179 RepID=A0A645I8A7_9ZZZZ
MPILSVLDHGHLEHLTGRGAVDVAAVLEYLNAPLLPCQPGDDAGFDGAEVRYDESAAIARDKRCTDQFRQDIWHRGIQLSDIFV